MGWLVNPPCQWAVSLGALLALSNANRSLGERLRASSQVVFNKFLSLLSGDLTKVLVAHQVALEVVSHSCSESEHRLVGLFFELFFLLDVLKDDEILVFLVFLQIAHGRDDITAYRG